MPNGGWGMGTDTTALQKSWRAVSSGAAKMMPVRTPISETTATVSEGEISESEIAAVAYQLWRDKGCPVGSDQEDWFRAEAMIKNAPVAKCEDRSRRPPIPRCDTRTESPMVAEFRWEGHWEVWESEWGARWVWE